MKRKRISDAITDIDAKYINEAAVFEKQSKNRFVKVFVSVAAVCAVAVIGAFSAVIIHDRIATGDSEGGGTDGKVNVNAEIEITGLENVITDEEAAVYLDSVTDSISDTLKRSGVTINGEFRITDKGYSHIRTGDSGNTLAADWRDYLAYDGDRIVAIITLVKENESGIKHHIAFGGPWFSEYAELLGKHKGEELVYIYIGDVEAFITPDNEVVTAIGTDVSANLEENKDYHSFFRTPYNVYVP